MKLHVYLRNLGVGSRRAAEKLILEGRVEVNGRFGVVGQLVDGTENIRIDRQQIGTQVPIEKSYVVINKPIGYTSTNAQHFDSEHSVLELLPYEVRTKTQWQIVGRLDKNSEGLLLLTDNGEVSYALTHPKFEVKKEYIVEVSKEIDENTQELLKKGVHTPEGITYTFKEVKKVGNCRYMVVLTEGKKREIREALGFLHVHVQRLQRVKLATLVLDGLQEGAWRFLQEAEVEELLRYVERVKNAIL